MIAANVVCLIVSAPMYPECLGMEATITCHEHWPNGIRHFAVMRNGRMCHAWERCFLPIGPRPVVKIIRRKETTQ